MENERDWETEEIEELLREEREVEEFMEVYGKRGRDVCEEEGFMKEINEFLQNKKRER